MPRNNQIRRPLLQFHLALGAAAATVNILHQILRARQHELAQRNLQSALDAQLQPRIERERTAVGRLRAVSVLARLFEEGAAALQYVVEEVLELGVLRLVDGEELVVAVVVGCCGVGNFALFHRGFREEGVFDYERLAKVFDVNK